MGLESKARGQISDSKEKEIPSCERPESILRGFFPKGILRYHGREEKPVEGKLKRISPIFWQDIPCRSRLEAVGSIGSRTDSTESTGKGAGWSFIQRDAQAAFPAALGSGSRSLNSEEGESVDTMPISSHV